MKIEMLVGNLRNEMFNVSDLVIEASWKTKRKGKPSNLEFQIIYSGDFSLDNGNTVSFKVDGNEVFYGYVFEISGSKEKTIKLNAYDQMRYLLFNDTYVFSDKKASDILKRISNDFGLVTGEIEDTGFVIPRFIQDDKKLIDIIYGSLDKTLVSTKETFLLYDDFGRLSLKNINNMRQNVVISGESNLGDYDWQKSIDNEVYNKVKIVRDNKELKCRQVYIAEDKNNMQNWGTLQYYKKVDDKMTDEQIKELAEGTLKLKNKEVRTLKLKDVISTDISNDLKLRAGSGVYVEIGDRNIKQFYLIEEATHKFSNGNLIMDFELKVV